MTATTQHGHRWFAAMWDRMSAPGERRFGKQIRARLLSDLRGRVLETGIGTGHSFPFYSIDAQVVATEPDSFMLERATRRLAELGRDNIELRQASAEELPFEDASFDHAVSMLVLCTVSDQSKALAELRRVLKPDGTFRFWEHIRNDDSAFWGAFQDIILPVWSWVGAGCHPNRRTRLAITDAGFRIEWIEQIRVGPGIPAIYGVARPA